MATLKQKLEEVLTAKENHKIFVNMEMDNLDRLKDIELLPDGSIEAENEHGTRFPLTDLSEEEQRVLAYILDRKWYDFLV